MTGPGPERGPEGPGGPTDPSGQAGPVAGSTPSGATDPGASEAPTRHRSGHRGATPSRTSRTWVGTAIGVLALILVLVFIFENLQSVKVTFFGASGSVPLALALLLAAVLGALVVLFIGSIRIVQLRQQVRRRAHDAAVGVPQGADREGAADRPGS